jgi:hypothetical protein
MKLGILVNTDKNLDAVQGITKAALAKGHEVILFNMDAGTKVVGTRCLQNCARQRASR